MLAQWCLTAWNVAIGRPNCSRTLAYSAAMLGALARRRRPPRPPGRPGPGRSAAGAAPGSTVAGAPSSVTLAARRVGSRLAGTSTWYAAGRTARSTSDVVAGPAPAARRPGRRRAPRRPSRMALPSARVDVAAERDGADHAAVGQAGQQLLRRGHRAPAAARTALAITVGTNGPGATAPAQLLDHDQRLRQPEARAAELLGDVQAEPAEAGQLGPEAGQSLGLGREQGAGGRAGLVLGQEVRPRSRPGRGGLR